MLVLDPQAAGALRGRRLCRGRRGRIAGATAAVDIATTTGGGGLSLVRRAVPRRMLRLCRSRPAAAPCRGAGRPPPTARGLGGELSGEFREPRRTGRGGDRPPRR